MALTMLRRAYGTQIRSTDQTDSRLRKVIQPENAFTLPTNVRYVAVISGAAWMSLHQEDVVLLAGQGHRIVETDHPIVVSALENTAVELEILA
jgi:hypothetical protein